MKIEDYSLCLQIILIVTLKSTRVMFTVELDGWQGDCIHMKLHTRILIVYRYNLSPLYLLLCFHFFLLILIHNCFNGRKILAAPLLQPVTFHVLIAAMLLRAQLQSGHLIHPSHNCSIDQNP
jgi:hypothetical protein